MICCLLVALVLGPLGLWVLPRAREAGGRECCAGKRRVTRIAGFGALAVTAICLGAWVLWRSQPATFHHICRVFPGT
jgi:hypothetical protein